jgi:hypothetical protein
MMLQTIVHAAADACMVQLPFLEPEYLALPDIPDAPAEEPLPIFFPPEALQVDIPSFHCLMP